MAGYWAGFPFWQTTLLCTAGGILGVIFTIPLRYAMVVKSDLLDDLRSGMQEFLAKEM